MTAIEERPRDDTEALLTAGQPKHGGIQPDIEKFTMFPNWIFKSQLSSHTRLVYLALKSHDWYDKGLVWPSVDLIAEKAALSRSTVYKALRELEDAGLITNEGVPRDQKTVRYRLHQLSQRQIEDLCVTRTHTFRDADTTVRETDTYRPPHGHKVDKENKTKEQRLSKKTHGGALCAQRGSGDYQIDYQGGIDGHQSDHRDGQRGDDSDHRGHHIDQHGDHHGDPGDHRGQPGDHLGDQHGHHRDPGRSGERLPDGSDEFASLATQTVEPATGSWRSDRHRSEMSPTSLSDLARIDNPDLPVVENERRELSLRERLENHQ